MKTYVYKKTGTIMLLAASFTLAGNWTHPGGLGEQTVLCSGSGTLLPSRRSDLHIHITKRRKHDSAECTLRFHLPGVQELVKLIYGERNQLVIAGWQGENGLKSGARDSLECWKCSVSCIA